MAALVNDNGERHSLVCDAMDRLSEKITSCASGPARAAQLRECEGDDPAEPTTHAATADATIVVKSPAPDDAESHFEEKAVNTSIV